MKEAIQAFDRLLEDGIIKDYAIGGAIAALFYAETVFTEDVDFFIVLAADQKGLINLRPVYDRLTERGGIVRGEHVLIGDSLAQVLVPPSDLEEEAVRKAAIQDVDGLKVKVFRPEYLIAIYLRILRPKDIGKITELLRSSETIREDLEDLIRRFRLEGQWSHYQKMIS